MIARLAVIAAVAAEGLAAYTLAEFVASGYREGEDYAISAVSFVGVAVVAFWLPRFLGGWDLPGRVATLLAAAIAYVLLYGIIRVEVVGDVAIWDLSWIAAFMRDSEAALRDGVTAIAGGLLLLATWVRGVVRSDQDVDLELIPKQVGLPFLAVTALLIFGAGSDRSAEIARGGAVFYAVAVLALACSQLAMSGATFGTVRAGGVTAALLGGTAAAALGCLLVFGLLFAVFGEWLGNVLGTVVDAVLTVLLTPIAWLLEKLFRLILPDSIDPPALQDVTRRTIEDAGAGSNEDRSAIEEGATFLFRALALIGLAGAAGAVALIFLRLRRRADAEGLAPPAVSRASFDDDGRRGLRSLFRRRPARDPSSSDSEAVRLYAEVLRRSDASGRPRPPGTTAEEFAPVLVDTFHTPITDEITRAFEEARYAGREPDPRTVDELRRRWLAANR